MDWLADYDYELADSQIARRPAEPRDLSRLLVLERPSGSRTRALFRDLPSFLRNGDLLVLNDTRVLRARLRGRLARTGRAVEVLLSHPEREDRPDGAWLAMLGPGRRLRSGDRLELETRGDCPEAPAILLDARAEGGLWSVVSEGADFPSIMDRWGRVPIPPYLRREDAPEDRAWYQTVYAREAGAVAAPTAGLHFTPDLLRRLEAAGVATTKLTLHVGPGTFLPVRARSVEEHRVPPERFHLPPQAAGAIAATRAAGGRILAVGTTTARALESSEGRSCSGWTGLTIVPGHRFRAVDGLVTNFHLPRSSLLLLVSAFAGRERILAAYDDARNAGFRFYSYGDAMLIL